MVGLRILPLGFVLTLAVAAVTSVSSCSDDEHTYVRNVGDGLTTPTMATSSVETFISDSGYTRYHISAPQWLMFEEASDPFWRFPDGIELEQYDLQMRVSATMTCDSATYLSQKRIWRLDGNVVMVNVLRDSFLTQQLFWDQSRRQVYSDSFIHIVRSNRIIEGYGFESNENITEYRVNNPTAIIPVERRDSQPQVEVDEDDEDGNTESGRRANPQRRSARDMDDEDEDMPVDVPAVSRPKPSAPQTARPAPAKIKPSR